jgi:hypothetical protein
MGLAGVIIALAARAAGGKFGRNACLFEVAALGDFEIIHTSNTKRQIAGPGHGERSFGKGSQRFGRGGPTTRSDSQGHAKQAGSFYPRSLRPHPQGTTRAT